MFQIWIDVQDVFWGGFTFDAWHWTCHVVLACVETCWTKPWVMASFTSSYGLKFLCWHWQYWVSACRCTTIYKISMVSILPCPVTGDTSQVSHKRWSIFTTILCSLNITGFCGESYINDWLHHIGADDSFCCDYAKASGLGWSVLFPVLSMPCFPIAYVFLDSLPPDFAVYFLVVFVNICSLWLYSCYVIDKWTSSFTPRSSCHSTCVLLLWGWTLLIDYGLIACARISADYSSRKPGLHLV